MNLALKPFQVHKALMASIKLEFGDPDDFGNWRQKAKAKLSELLGFDLIDSQKRIPLTPAVHWRRESELGTIERISFASEPNADVIGHVCLPRGVKPPYPFFICLQGHSTGTHNSIGVSLNDDSSELAVEGDRDFGLACMRYGVAALCLEQRGFGEREDAYTWTPRCQGPAAHALMLGRTLLGERVYDVDRAIDYLLSRGDADPERIGVMGNSGGGTVSFYAGALLDRLTHAMPSCSFSSYKASIMSMEHCICNYVPGILRFFEAGDVAGLIAPRPLVIVSGRLDEIFPLNAAQAEFKRVQQIYARAGAPGNCRHIIGAEGHRFYAKDAWPAMKELMN